MQYLTHENAEDLNFIKQILNKNGFSKIKNIVPLKSGSRSVAYDADEYIVRFPKAEIIWQTMKREKNIIDMIFPHLTPTIADKIHKIDLIENEYPFSISERFIGKICDGRPESEYAVLYQNLTPMQQEKLACDIALFFHKLHQIDYKKLNIPKPTEAIDNWDVTTENNFDFEQVQKILSRYKININDYMVKTPNTATALCHNDLSGSNILLNPEKEDVLVGIIDFGNVMIMPKYQDFFPLYKIHRKLAIDTLKEYNKLTSSPIDQKQIDCMALLYTGWGLARIKNPSSPYFMKLLKPFLEE